MIEEKEVKILLSKEEYNRVAELFRWDKEFVQINYYYGNNETVYSYGDNSTIRVREKEGKHFLQVKIPEQKRGSLHIKKEYEEQVSDIPDHISRLELERLTGQIFNKDVMLLGKLITVRKESQLSNDILICLDKNGYLNKTDYEIEMEFNQVYPHEVINMLENIGIRTNKEIVGKFSRFIKRYKSECETESMLYSRNI